MFCKSTVRFITGRKCLQLSFLRANFSTKNVSSQLLLPLKESVSLKKSKTPESYTDTKKEKEKENISEEYFPISEVDRERMKELLEEGAKSRETFSVY